jgi:hypothetical protein
MDNKELGNQDIISLLNIYLNEFIHRNDVFLSTTFRFFYASLIVILLPNITGYLGINFSSLPIVLFRIVGFIMSLAFFYITISYAKRLEAITNTYNTIIKKFKSEYQRQNIEELKFGKLFKWRISYVLILSMFFSLMAINILFIFYNL